jgi:hypothetical protein
VIESQFDLVLLGGDADWAWRPAAVGVRATIEGIHADRGGHA